MRPRVSPADWQGNVSLGMLADTFLGGQQGGGGRGRAGVVGSGRGFQSQDGTLGSWSTEAPDDFDWSGDEDGFWPVSRLRQGYIDYLTAKVLEYQEQQQSRHYYHGAQYTPDEIRLLRNRRQPIITYNRTGRKIDQIIGVLQRIRTDPKAYPRSPKGADGAEIATQSVRAVLEANDWEFIDALCAAQAAIEGIGGLEIKLVDGDQHDPDVALKAIAGDDFFYDPRSFEAHFDDARYMGIAKWLDVEAAVELFPEKEMELRTLMVETGFDLTTHSDREFKWIYVNEKRLRLVEQWYRHNGKWYWAFYCSHILLDQGVSPFVDERGRPMNRFMMFSANVDHDGDRYGYPRNLKGPQDELNQRRSKTLFMSNVTRLIAQKGAVDDVERARKEYARPDGYVEYNPGFEKPHPDDKTADLQAQLSLMQDARTEIESFANITPDLITRDIPGDHSGVAINMLQRAGIAELGPFLRNWKVWKKRVYRAIWNVVQRTWTHERFVRVTDSQGLAQFFQLNAQEFDQWNRPIIVNAVGNLSVEMTMDEGPDEANAMQDAYDVLVKYPPGTIPPAVLIELSPLSSRYKQRIQQMMQAPPDQMQMQAKQLELREKAAKVGELDARAQRHRSQSVSDAGRTAHLLSEAHLNAQEGFHRAIGASQGPSAQPEMQPSPQADFGGLQGSPSGGPQGPPGAAPQQPGAAPGPAGPPPNPMAQLLAQARRAPDGRHYVPDPRRPGKFLMMAA